MKFQIKSAAGLFHALSLQAVVSEAALNLMRAERDTPQRWPSDHPVHDQLQRLVPLLEQLPVFPARMVDVSPVEEQAAPEFQLSHRSSALASVGTLNARCWVAVGTPKGATSRHTFDVPDLTPETMGWAAAEQLARDNASLRELMLTFGFAYDAYGLRLKGAKGIVKRSRVWTLEEQAEEKIFARSETFAIYSLTSKGYLNDKGSFVPIGGARTFETPVQAARTAKSRRLKAVVVVRMQTQVVSVEPILDSTQDLGELGAALVELEGEVLRETLRRAKEEDLLAQLAVLREQHKDLLPSGEPVIARPRRRM